MCVPLPATQQFIAQLLVNNLKLSKGRRYQRDQTLLMKFAHETELQKSLEYGKFHMATTFFNCSSTKEPQYFDVVQNSLQPEGSLPWLRLKPAKHRQWLRAGVTQSAFFPFEFKKTAFLCSFHNNGKWSAACARAKYLIAFSVMKHKQTKISKRKSLILSMTRKMKQRCLFKHFEKYNDIRDKPNRFSLSYLLRNHTQLFWTFSNKCYQQNKCKIIIQEIRERSVWCSIPFLEYQSPFTSKRFLPTTLMKNSLTCVTYVSPFCFYFWFFRYCMVYLQAVSC